MSASALSAILIPDSALSETEQRRVVTRGRKDVVEDGGAGCLRGGFSQHIPAASAAEVSPMRVRAPSEHLASKHEACGTPTCNFRYLLPLAVDSLSIYDSAEFDQSIPPLLALSAYA